MTYFDQVGSALALMRSAVHGAIGVQIQFSHRGTFPVALNAKIISDKVEMVRGIIGTERRVITMQIATGQNGFLAPQDQTVSYNIALFIGAASWLGGVATLTLTAPPVPALTVGQSITVAGVNNNTFNGTFVITAVNGSTISYALAANPGGDSSGGVVTASDGDIEPIIPTDTMTYEGRTWEADDPIGKDRFGRTYTVRWFENKRLLSGGG